MRFLCQVEPKATHKIVWDQVKIKVHGMTFSYMLPLIADNPDHVDITGWQRAERGRGGAATQSPRLGSSSGSNWRLATESGPLTAARGWLVESAAVFCWHF